MSMQPVGGWLDDISNFFTGDSSSNYDSPSGYTGVSGDPFGYTTDKYFEGSIFNPTYQNPGLSDYDIASRDQYFTAGGTQGYTTTDRASGNFFSDVANGAGNFFNGITSSLNNLGGLFNTGLEAYARVQTLINQIDPEQRIIQIPGRSGAFVDKGGGNIVPLEMEYPSLRVDIDRANQAARTNTLLIAGAVGLGLVLILKKK